MALLTSTGMTGDGGGSRARLRRRARPVIVVGNLTIDDVIQPDGSSQMATLGGNSVHAAAAALTWVARRRHRRPLRGRLPGRGARPPARGRRRHRRHPAHRRADRAELGHLRGRRHAGTGSTGRRRARERRGGPAARRHPRPRGWTAGLPPVVHVAAMPLAAATAIVRSVRERARRRSHHAGHARGLAAGRRRARRRPARSTCSCPHGRNWPSSWATTTRAGAAGELTAAGVDMRRGQAGRRRRAGGQAGQPARARPGQPGRGRRPHRRRRQLLRRVRGRARAGRATSSAPPGGAARRPPPRSARPARCGCWTSARSPATCCAGGGHGNGWGRPRRDGRFAAGRAARRSASPVTPPRPAPLRIAPVGREPGRPVRTMPTTSRSCAARSRPSPTSSPAASPIPAGMCSELADWLAGRGIEHLYLTGCGDSAFAGLAAVAGVPAAQPAARAPGARAGPGPLPRPLPAAGQRGAGDLVLRQGRPHHRGRAVQAAAFGHPVIALTGNRRRPAGGGRRPDPAHRRAHARLLPGHQHLHRDAVHAHRAGAADARGPAATGRSAAPASSCPARRPRRSTGATPRRPAPRPGWRPRRSSPSSAPGRTRRRPGSAPRSCSRASQQIARRHQHRGVGARGVLHHQAR